MRGIARFWRDERASTAIVFAAALVPLMAVAGGAVDYSFAVSAENKLQVALDSAVLSGVAEGIPDGNRAAVMQTYFKANTDPTILKAVKTVNFTYSSADGRGEANVVAKVPSPFLGIIGHMNWSVTAHSQAMSKAMMPRVLDVAMCIDITGSMQNTIDAVRNNALNFENNVNNELASRSMPEFDAVRVRVTGYRDFGGNNPAYRPDHYKVVGGGYVDKMPNPGAVWRGAGDARNYGDDAPLTTSAYFNLPAQAATFTAFVDALQANGGGDYPESGLECINVGLNAPWLKVGDPTPGLGTPAQAVFPMIVLWTDIDAQPPSHSWSLLNPNYPADTVMPRNYAGLRAKWDDPLRINQQNKLLVTFMPNSGTPVWNNIKTWPNYFSGGNLATGNTLMVDKIVDAIASLPAGRTPVLTQ
jgi:Flp pilus assembly protein TadG